MIIIDYINDTYESDFKYVFDEKDRTLFYNKQINKNAFYTIIEYNKKNKSVTFNQDDLGDLSQYYYSVINEKLIIDTSIVPILKMLKEKEFDKHGLYFFLSCGFIPNEKTLVKNIYKVVPGFINIYFAKEKRIKLKRKKLQKRGLVFTRKKYLLLLSKNIFDNCIEEKNTGFALSSGFDSNLLVSLYSKNSDKKIDFFSVGGKIGVNEIPIVKEIIKSYNINTFHSSLVDCKTLKSFPKIVYLYEGLFYERGIFLQYELYKLCQNQNLNLILGEGADQILHCRATKTNNITDIIKEESFSLYRNCPYEMLRYIVLKKSSLLMSKTGNNIIYPYLYKNFRTYNYSFPFLFGFDKKMHKKIVKHVIPTALKGLINKIGGATEQISLYESKEVFDLIYNYINNTKYKGLKCEHNKTELSLDDDYILKIIYLILFEKIFLLSDEYDGKSIDNLDLYSMFGIY